MDFLIVLLLTPGLITRVHGEPWLFEEIKPLTDSDAVKKSDIPDLPVKEVDPTSPTINIKEDIRKDILGNNHSSSKFKEGVKKLLDFLETGPKAAEDVASKTEPLTKTSSHSENTTRDKQALSTGNHLSSLEEDGHDNSLKPEKSNSNFVGERKEPPAIPMRFVNQQKEPPAIPMRSEIHGDGGKDSHVTSIEPDKESKNFITDQRKEPPAIPMRSEIHGDGALSQAKVPQSNADASSKMLYHGIMAKSRIPYSSMAAYKATQLLQNNGIGRNTMPHSPLQYYHPYSAFYQRSSLPYRHASYGFNRGYKTTGPNTVASQGLRYPYNQRRMLPIKPYNFNAALRTNARLPLYRGSTIRSPAYSPHLPYTKTYVPRSPFLLRNQALSLLAAKAHIHNLRYLQTPHQMPYQQMPKWPTLLGKGGILKPALTSPAIKFRRMAIEDRGHPYNGLSTSHARDKVAQKTPLQLPLASIMTAARIVVPARPLTQNGDFKSNVETLPSVDPEEKVARAV